MKKILFVCTGNTCRSSMAQALANKIIADLELSDKLKVESAGISAIPGMKASENAIKALSQKGIQLDNHRSKRLTKEMVREADVILTMTRRHKQDVLSVVPEAQKKIYTLKEFVLEHSEGEDKDTELAKIAAKLEKKEREYYSKYGDKLEELQREKEELEKKLKDVEEKIQDWHLGLYDYTKEERTELKEIERKTMDVDIPDPFGQPLESYKDCAGELEELIKKMINKLAEE